MANPEGKGGFKKGASGNPGGQTAEQKAARDLLNAALDTDEMRNAFLEGYTKQLKQGNALILVDYANRRLGKPAETVNVAASVTKDEAAVPLTTEMLIDIATKERP